MLKVKFKFCIYVTEIKVMPYAKALPLFIVSYILKLLIVYYFKFILGIKKMLFRVLIRNNINTIVVYIKDVITKLYCGTIKYDIKSFYMSSFDRDTKLQNTAYKIENNIELTEKDIMTLSFMYYLINLVMMFQYKAQSKK